MLLLFQGQNTRQKQEPQKSQIKLNIRDCMTVWFTSAYVK